jgi:hypothetical protein
MARSKSLLQICTEAIEDLSDFDIPTTIIGNEDPTAIALKRAALKTGRELAAKVKWQALVTEHTFATVASTASYALPTDYGQFSQVTFWDRTNDWELLGPATPRIWQYLQSATVSAGVRYWYRVAGNFFQLYPTPTTVNTIVYEYYSRYYCATAAGTAKEDWTLDTDLCRLDAELFILGVVYYFKKSKGLPFAEDKADYLTGILDYQSNDTPKAPVDFGANNPLVDVGIGNIPDTGFGA